MKKYMQFIYEKKKIDKKLIDQYGKYKIYEVNGEQIRDISKADEEYGLVSIHPYFPKLIPATDIWIEDDVKEDERLFLISSALYALRLIEDGVKIGDAYDKAIKYEKKLRSSEKASKKNPSKTDDKADDDIYIKKYCGIKSDNLTVWLVDAEKVRDQYKTDYLEGGHGYVYSWIPNNEIWIENGIHNKEIPFIILHEFVERTLMKDKHMKYNKAHEIAAKIEYSKRPDKFTKSDVEKLTEKDAIEMTKKD